MFFFRHWTEISIRNYTDFVQYTYFWWFLAYKTSEYKANYTHSSNKLACLARLLCHIIQASPPLPNWTSYHIHSLLVICIHWPEPNESLLKFISTNAHHSNNSSLVFVTHREATKSKHPEWPHIVCSYSLFNIAF